jgi:hypothetical protein
MVTTNVAQYCEMQALLKEPFDIRLLEFRPGQGGFALAYVDVREYEKRLQDVAAGLYHIDGLQIIGTGDNTIIGINVSILGIPMAGVSDPNKPTRAYAQALKRACVGHGLGAYLYDMPRLPNVPIDDKKQVSCSHLSIAAYCYEHLGLIVPDDVREELSKLPPHMLYDPNKRSSYQPAAQQPPRTAPRANAAAPRQGGSSPKLSSEAENPHNGKISFKQVNALYAAGITDDEIELMDTTSARAAVTAKFNGAAGDEIREQFLPAATGGRRNW